jgi:hypothetical protein
MYAQHWNALQQSAQPSLERFHQMLTCPKQVQENFLQNILHRNRETLFGQAHGFSNITSFRAYQEAVPVHNYAQMQPYIEQISAGKTNILTDEAVVAFELTGGSTQGAKLIPYTRSGLDGFRSAVLTWVADLQQRPGITAGRTYWSISPAVRAPTRTIGGIAIGMASDAVYFGEQAQAALSNLMVASPAIANEQDFDSWQRLTLLALLKSPDLSLISVWSPTFLLQLLEAMQRHGNDLIAEVTLTDPNRANLLRNSILPDGIDTLSIWPNLDTISCWTDAASGWFVPRLQALFPHAWIQGKGLLATEGIVTLPLLGCRAPALAVGSAFYEFLDTSEQVWLAHELQEGEVYRVVLTTASGLYRYDLGDCVSVCGWLHDTPLLKFVGRSGTVSDLCGEKLCEDFVLARIVQARGFAMLSPCLKGQPHYILFLDAAHYDEAGAVAFTSHLDSELMANPQYAYARRLGQLGAVVPCCIERPMDKYVECALRLGQRLGDIKPPVLRRELDWQERLGGQ